MKVINAKITTYRMLKTPDILIPLLNSSRTRHKPRDLVENWRISGYDSWAQLEMEFVNTRPRKEIHAKTNYIPLFYS
jgi:hypothetical protein